MISKGAVLVFNGNKHCFVTLPRSFVGKLHRDKPVVIELQNSEGRQLFTNWNGAVSIDLSQGSEVVEVNGLYGNKQGFKDGETVVVSVHHEAATCERVHVQPQSVDDWEILEMHAASIETSLLSSLRVVWMNQTFPVWVHRSLCVFVQISSVEPDAKFCLLEQNSEVIVAPRTRAPPLVKKKEEEVKSGEEEAPKGRLDATVSFLSSLWKKDEKKKRVEKDENVVEIDASLSVAALEDFVDGDHMAWKQSTNVVIAKQTLEAIGIRTQNREFLAQIQKIPSPNEILEESKKDHDRAKRSTIERTPLPACTVRVLVVDKRQGQGVTLDRWLPERRVLVNRLLRKQLSLDFTGRIRMTSAERCVDVASVAISPLASLPEGFTSDLLEVAFRAWLSDNTSESLPLVVDHSAVLRCPLKPDLSQDISVSVLPSDSKSIPNPFAAKVHPGIFPHSSFQITDPVSPLELFPAWRSPKEIDPDVPCMSLKHLGGLKQEQRVAMTTIDQCLGQRPLARLLFGGHSGISSGALLVSGPKGVGKTAFTKALCHEASHHPNMAFISIVECKTLRGKRIESIRKYLEQVLHECAWRQPSVLLLDDLDHVASAPAGPDQEMTPDALYHSRVAQVLKDLLKAEMHEATRLSLVVTAKSRSSLHQILSAPTDLHLFKKVIELQPPDQMERVSVLESILASRLSSSPGLDLSMIASETEGFVARDLVSLVDRALHAHLMQHEGSKEILLLNADFTSALRGFTPASLRNISLQQETGVSWESVGGLHDVRSTLIETLQWPAKYPDLFSKCPLRLRSGLLLYGAPGTGKTLLASAVAQECGLNFISIKGPELLSKYIGASEQAVRDTFARAQSAKPCILFFDEFDSMAPRRGHDSTGVTDRVVNQLLTQLDGVEGLEGVYVLAATSRPDLIDPALLRPGRLDKALCCNLPSADEQLEILKALARCMNLAEDVDLSEVISLCQHFTGADFKALLYNAQLEAIHEGTKDFVKAETRQVKDDIAHMKSVEEGTHEITPEEYETLAEQVTSAQAESEVSARREERKAALIHITQRHLVQAANNMTPSVSQAERMRYHIIYKTFVASRGGNFTDSMQGVGKRATLA